MALDEAPLSCAAAKLLARKIIQTGTVHFRPHALKELAKDGCTTVDAINVMRGGAWQDA